MTGELIVYALIAVGLVFWLRSILGTRDEDDLDHTPPNMQGRDGNNVVNLDGSKPSQGSNIDAMAAIAALIETPKGNMHVSEEVSRSEFENIVNADSDFNVQIFLQAAQDAFVYIVESFAEGDRETLENLLGDDVYSAFDEAITAREQSGETMVTEILSIKKSEIIEAHLDGKMAMITVRFWAEETSVIKDKNEEIISGNPDATSQMRDVWTFARDTKSRDPRWLVVETREDGVEDNDIVPNSH